MLKYLFGTYNVGVYIIRPIGLLLKVLTVHSSFFFRFEIKNEKRFFLFWLCCEILTCKLVIEWLTESRTPSFSMSNMCIENISQIFHSILI